MAASRWDRDRFRSLYIKLTHDRIVRACETSLHVKLTGDAYISHATIRQADFGIRPISAGGGIVKVKIELDIDFRMVTRPE